MLPYRSNLMDYFHSLYANGQNAGTIDGFDLGGGITFVVIGHTILDCFVIRSISFTYKNIKIHKNLKDLFDVGDSLLIGRKFADKHINNSVVAFNKVDPSGNRSSSGYCPGTASLVHCLGL